MMDLTVEIHGDAGSMEECLDQFTAKVRLHGDNMYKCDGIQARPSCLLPTELLRKEVGEKAKINELDSSLQQHAESSLDAVCADSPVDLKKSSTDGSGFNVAEEFPLNTDSEDAKGDTEVVFHHVSLPIVKDDVLHDSESVTDYPQHQKKLPLAEIMMTSHISLALLVIDITTELDGQSFETSSSTSDVEASFGNKINSDVGSSRNLTEKSTAVENCKVEVDSSLVMFQPWILQHLHYQIKRTLLYIYAWKYCVWERG